MVDVRVAGGTWRNHWTGQALDIDHLDTDDIVLREVHDTIASDYDAEVNRGVAAARVGLETQLTGASTLWDDDTVAVVAERRDALAEDLKPANTRGRKP